MSVGVTGPWQLLGEILEPDSIGIAGRNIYPSFDPTISAHAKSLKRAA